ncbi:Undecaprenyl-phosphate alpha-N-acetylglucosaminyl 1-phosphate transferase [Serratia rubidaea]|uniref:Undecaprenyl-phosphate alpha-N-acetylglucosaminyl 1-phosphate transferase n=1 Tax=Serratia rubidaea TaxID=61652 RepID=A0A4U9HJ11_SERRU|nr:Undecaprenyl-phosphate alpha-N-acetylglucosaminyl 1-phosphate transferase [Serratia rubidaea]
MVDGIDGQLGIQCCVTLSGLTVLFALGGRPGAVFWCLSLIATLAAYLLFNLGLLGRRNQVFMGDAGSMVMGFTVLWLLLAATQGGDAVMRPVGALWLIAMPLMDMASVMLRRIARRQSPFRARARSSPPYSDTPWPPCPSGVGGQRLLAMALAASACSASCWGCRRI